MIFFENFELRNKAESILENTGIYEDGIINFVLCKKIKEKNKLIIGFKDFDENQFIMLTNNKVIKDDCIRIKKKYRELFHEGVETFIFEKLDNGFDPVYIDLDLNAELWMFLGDYIYEIEYILKGVYSYLNFCLETGINQELLLSNYPFIFDDLIGKFYYNRFWDYRILENFLSGMSRLALGEKKTKDNKLIYTVFHFKYSRIDENLLIDKENFISKEKAIEYIKTKLAEFNAHNKENEEELFKYLLTESEESDEE